MPLFPWTRRSFLGSLAALIPGALLTGQAECLWAASRRTTRIVGVGGAGLAVIQYLIATGVPATACLAIDSDQVALGRCSATKKIRIGRRLLRGLPAGARPDIGQRAAEENLTDIVGAIEGGGLVILTGGLGGGTASGALPMIANAAKSSGAGATSIVALPAIQEGRKRRLQASSAVAGLRRTSTHVITVQFPDVWNSLWPMACFTATREMASHILGAHHAWINGASWT